MNTSAIRKYMDDTGELPADALLGHIVLYTVNDGEYRHNDVELWFDELNLNPAFLPEPNRPVDAYKKATAAADEFEYDLPDGNTAQVLVRDVMSDSEMIIRHLIREVRDPRRKRLAYGKIGEAVFYRPKVAGGKAQIGSERFRLNVDNAALLNDERRPLDALVHRISQSYDRHCNAMDGMKMRAVIRDYVKSLNAVAVKSGVYFVHVTRKDELERLRTFVDRLGNGCTMQMIPLVDLKEQRSMVIEAFQTEAEKALTEVVQEIARVRATRATITADAYGKLKTRYDSVIMRAKEYTRTLNVSQDRTAGAAEVALEALSALQYDMLKDS